MFRKKKPPINPQEEQRAKLRELGSYLQQTRTEQGLPLDAIAAKTRIPLRLLQAIEAGKLEELPEAVYIRGFIKRFADILGLDGTQLSQTFPIYVNFKGRRSRFGLRLPSFQIRPLHLYFFYILLVILSVRGLSEVLKQSSLETSTWDNPPPPMTTPSLNKPSTPRSVQPASNAPQPAGKPLVVDVQLKNQCRLKVVVDGKTEFEGVLPQGTRRTWSAKEKLTVRADNAGGVLVTFNNQQPKQLGEPGKAEEVTYQVNPRS
jgi:cytoskeletal protein RodZ